jgi:hypothetical protein
MQSGVDEQSFLAAKTHEQTPVLTLVKAADPSEGCDPLIQALMDKLPRPNIVWPIGERAKWLKAAAMAFNLVYKLAEGDQPDLKIEEKSSGLKSVS